MSAHMPDNQLFTRSCFNAAIFPKNIVRSTTSKHNLEGFYNRLEEHSSRLFCEDGKASIELWEHRDNVQEFRSKPLTSVAELETHLEGEQSLIQEGPRSRFVFVHAPNSRSWLRISRQMITCILTHHQAMPNFLDFIFPFGHQHYAEDFHFSGFREDTRLVSTDGGLCIPELGRSGREIRMSYSLKSVEPLKVEPDGTNEDWPWSVRQTALYHSFDLETGKASWIVIKGSHLMRDRIKSETEPSQEGPSELTSFDSTASAFASTLATHLVFCDWCDEDWRWYITFLEKRLQQLTRRSLTVDVPEAPNMVEPSTFQVLKPAQSIRRTLSQATKNAVTAPRRLTFRDATEKTKFQPSFPQPQSPMSPPPSVPSAPKMPPVLPPGFGGPTSTSRAETDEIFSVSTLQKVQAIEDKVNEILLILEANIRVVTGIKNHYESILDSEDCPVDLKTGCKSEVAHFRKRIDNIVGDLEIQHSSAETLLRLLDNRKSLLSGLLNLRNIEASKELAQKSQYSAKKMEEMTESMHQIAVKTKQETVSMRIITLVTLFFLPGTFISVSYLCYKLTIMSTDIVKWESTQESGKVFQLGALQLYLAITIPMMLITFAAWWGVYWWVNRRQDSSKGGRFKGWLP